MKTIFFHLLCPLVLAGFLHSASAQDPAPPKIKVVQLEKLEINEGLVTDEIARRFDTKAKTPARTGEITSTDKIEVGENQVTRKTSVKVTSRADTTQSDNLKASVENRIKGAFASSLAQALSATKLLQLAVRDKSLETLKKEWQVSEELGKPAADGSDDMSVERADYIATAVINDFVADRKVLGREEAAIWSNAMSATLEITKVAGGTKKIITENVSDGGKGRRGVGGEAANFNAQQIQTITQKLAKKLAERILDNISPPRIIACKGPLIIIDRGVAAGVKPGDSYKLIEKVDNSLGTDAGFPFGSAVVEFVNEDTSNLRLDPPVPGIASPEKITLQKNSSQK